MKRLFYLILIGSALSSCDTTTAKKKIAGNQDSAFTIYKENFIVNRWAIYPDAAQSVGYHQYDSLLLIPDQANRERELAFADQTLDSLGLFDSEQLSDNNKIDFHLIQDECKRIKWYTNEFKSYEWDPSGYNVSGLFALMLSENYEPLDQRLHTFYLKMENIPAYYEAAKKNIKNPTTEHTQLAIEQNIGGISVFETDLKDALSKSTLKEEDKTKILNRASESIAAIKSYADWLKNMKNDSPRSFRLGKELYEKKFAFDIQSGYSVNQIVEKALQHKSELHEKMFVIADKLWEKYRGNAPKPDNKLQLIKEVIDKISVKHVKPEEFQSAIDKQIPLLVKFIKDNDLLYIDPSKPLVVRKEPAYMAGVAGASISAPGPYDKNGNTYYNVGSLSGWDKDRSESYLREYNHYILQILNIHEAIPGHYTQLVYSNQSPSIVKSILGNGAMVEGWAVYTELMMLENGYGNNEPEMWLMYYKWNLRTTCNTILDYSVHTKDMSKEDAMNLLVNEAFQQTAEAEGKWRRVSLTQVQLCSYFTGYTEIYDLREELKKKQGTQFNLKQFHENFLSYGSVPVKYIREILINTDSKGPILQTTSILNNKVEIKIPADFNVMDQKKINARYPADRKPVLVYCNKAEDVSIAFDMTGNKADQASLLDYQEAFMTVFEHTYPTGKWRSKELNEINGKKVGSMEFIIPDPDNNMFNLLFFTDVDGKLLLCTIKCPEEKLKEWQPRAKEILNSLKTQS